MLWHGKNFRGFLNKAREVLFDKTGTTLQSNNVQDAISEINSELANVIIGDPILVALDLSTVGDKSIEFTPPSTPAGYTRMCFLGDSANYRAYVKGIGASTVYYTVVNTYTSGSTLNLFPVYKRAS